MKNEELQEALKRERETLKREIEMPRQERKRTI